MKINWIAAVAIVGTVILGIIFFSISTFFEYPIGQNQNDQVNKLQELAKKGVVTYNSSGLGENIIDYRFGVKDKSIIDPELEKTLRQKQRLLTDQFAKPLYSEKQINIPTNHVTISREWKALEVGIEPDFLVDKNIPTYFEDIRNVTGDEINIVLVPSFPIRTQ